jgi:hypothetical protein
MLDLHRWRTTVVFAILATLLFSQAAFADSVMFDFNQLPASGKRKHQGSTPTVIESYMEGIYGSDITVGPGIQAANSALTNGKGKNGGISLTFGAEPIGSFAVDWGVQKGGSGIIIMADGVIIYQHLLTKSEKKTGLFGHLDPFIFDQPIETLQFIGIKKTKFAIDNLEVNFQQGDGGSGGETGTGSQLALFEDSNSNPPSDPPINTGNVGDGGAGGGTGARDGPNAPPITTTDVFVTGPDIQQTAGQVPEPASWVMLALGLLAAGVSKKLTRHG